MSVRGGGDVADVSRARMCVCVCVCVREREMMFWFLLVLNKIIRCLFS